MKVEQQELWCGHNCRRVNKLIWWQWQEPECGIETCGREMHENCWGKGQSGHRMRIQKINWSDIPIQFLCIFQTQVLQGTGTRDKSGI